MSEESQEFDAQLAKSSRERRHELFDRYYDEPAEPDSKEEY